MVGLWLRVDEPGKLIAGKGEAELSRGCEEAVDLLLCVCVCGVSW